MPLNKITPYISLGVALLYCLITLIGIYTTPSVVNDYGQIVRYTATDSLKYGAIGLAMVSLLTLAKKTVLEARLHHFVAFGLYPFSPIWELRI